MVHYIRKATIADVGKIGIILEDARDFLKKQGLPQWQNGYGPNLSMIEQDIQKQEGYVLIYNNDICGYATLAKGIEDSYLHIREGQWDLTYDSYITIHRVAIDPFIRGQGIGGEFLHDLVIVARNLEYHDIRIDTHPGNIIMEKVILHTGFVYKGMIELPIPEGERKAYQLLLD